MRLLVDDPGSVQAQMERDQTLLDRADQDDHFEVMLRIYVFDPPGITLGRGQDPGRELNLERCERDGIRWAVRPTGGRAIFHEHEWTYAFICRLTDPDWGGTRAETYERCTALIAASLARLRVDVDMGRPTAGRPGRVRSAVAAAPPCFASVARHEITRRGRKLVGSAQRRTRSALLQQGSILLGQGHLRLPDYLALSDRERDVARESLRARATDAADVLGGATLSDWAGALSHELRNMSLYTKPSKSLASMVI